jgi:hypothetical protein
MAEHQRQGFVRELKFSVLRRKEGGEDKVEIISGESERIHNVKPKLTEIDFRHPTGVFQIRIIEVTRIERSRRRHL